MKIEHNIIKKREIKQKIYIIIITLLELVTLIADIFWHANCFWKLNIFIFASIVLSILFIFIRETDYTRTVMIRMFLFPLLLSASLTVPYIIWKVFFPNEKLQMNTLTQVYVSYLSFASALILGYVVYINNVKKEERQLKKNAKMLYDNLDNLDMWLIRINYGEKVETYKRKASWEKYYYEIYSDLGYDEKTIKNELDKL